MVANALQIDVEPDVDDPGKCSLILSGYVRTHSYSVNQLVRFFSFCSFEYVLTFMCLTFLQNRFMFQVQETFSSAR